MQWLSCAHLSPRASLGVLQLRFTVATYLIWLGLGAAVQMAADRTMWTWWQVGVPSLLAAVLVLLGALTFFVQGVVVLSQCAYLIGNASAGQLGQTVSPWPPVFAISIAIALALLGPGNYSIDASLFGRRQIHIPRLPHRPTK